MTERKWLSVCAAFAFGEWTVSMVPNFSEAWPVAVLVAVLVALWGFGFALPGWWLVFAFVLGVAVFLRSSVSSELMYRDRPWMRKTAYARTVRCFKPSPLARAVRSDLSGRMGVGLGHSPQSADINRAIMLGERRRLHPDVRRVFVESGSVHVFAISGLHVMIVARIFSVLAAFFAVSLRFRPLVSVPLLWGYVWMVGMPPSAVRAAVMASIYFSAAFFWRKPNAVVSWSIAFLGIHVYAPALIGDIGCRLSFVVMLAIILAARLVKEASTVKQHVFVTFAAWASGVPIVAAAFGAVTPGGLLTNFVLVPAAGVAVASGMAGIASSWISERVAAHFNNIAALVTGAMAGVSAAVASFPGANFEICGWGFVESVIWYAVLFCIPVLMRIVAGKRLF